MKENLSPNKTATLLALIILVLIAAFFGYRLQIGPSGLTFENNYRVGHPEQKI